MAKIKDILKMEFDSTPQSKGRVKMVANALIRINELRAIRRRSYEVIRDRHLKDYWDDSVKRFLQYKQRPAYKQGPNRWRSNTASNTPGDKLISILSKLAGQAMEAQVLAVDDVSFIARMRERVLGSLLKAAGKKNDDDKQLVFEELAAMSKGTVIGFEGWRHARMTVRDVTDQNPETGEIKIKEREIKKWNDVWSEIVPIENFYPGDVFIRPGQIQDMKDCAMRKVMKEDQFKVEFSRYTDVGKVVTKNSIEQQNEETLFYKFDEDLEEDEVELWYYFNQETDEFIMIANGIWINPIGDSTVSPLLWNHKKLPFWANVFEPFAEDFFYGRSLPDKLATMSDMSDALFDRILDQLALAVHKPIVTRKRHSSLTKGFLHPGSVIELKTTGDLRGEFATVDIDSPGPAHLQMLGILENRMDKISISSDVSDAGRSKTATQVLQEREAAVELVSLFLKFMEFGIRDKNRLRMANIIQFYTLPIHKKDKEIRFRKVVLRGEKLSDGKLGTREIEFTTDDIFEAQQRSESERNESIESLDPIKVTPDFIRNFNAEITIVPASSIKQSEAVRQALELNFQQVMSQLYPDKMNRDTAFEDMLHVFKKDKRRLTAQTQEEQQDLPPGQEEAQLPETASNILGGLGGSLRQKAEVPGV